MTAYSFAPGWVADYVGLPFKDRGRERDGLDCWGLVRLVLGERAGIELPSYVERYERAADHDAVAAIVKSGIGAWQRVFPGRARIFDGVLFNIVGKPVHMGLVVADGEMLHIMEGIDACVDRYDGLRWRTRLEGIYRHAGLV